MVVKGTTGLSGKKASSREWTILRFTFLSLLTEGTKTPSISDRADKRRSLSSVLSFFHSWYTFRISVIASSPSPIRKASIKADIGMGFIVHGPPAMTRGQPFLFKRSSDRRGIPPRWSMFNTVGYESSYCRLNPIMSKSLNGRFDSREERSTPCFFIASSRSSHGEKTLSAEAKDMLFISPYRILSPR